MTTSREDDHSWQDRLSEYLDGTLTSAEVPALEEHLNICEYCRGALADLRTVVDRIQRDPADPAPPGAWPRIARRLAPQSLASTVPDYRARGRFAYAFESRTLRRIATAASFTLTFVSGVWLGAAICASGLVGSLPVWLHFGLPGFTPPVVRIPSSMARGPLAADSTDDGPLARLVAQGVEQALADAERAFRAQPATPELQQVLRQLAVKRKRAHARVDSLSAKLKP